MSETNGAVPTCGFTGHKFSYCDCEVPTPMTTDQALLARIDEVLDWAKGNAQDTDMAIHAVKALRVVVEKKPRANPYEGEGIGDAHTTGYNQCLADVKADIKKELG